MKMQIDFNNKYTKLFLFIIFLRAIFGLSVGYVDDDSYHWSWSQELSLSYYDHPGMIAWLEYLTTSLFGNTRLGVRLACFLCFSATLVLTWKMAKEWFGEKAAAFSCAMLLFTPLWGFGGYVSSPEPPYFLCWVLAIWVFWNGVREDNQRWSTKKTWLWLGVLMGVGLNSKFHMALLAPGLGLYLLVTPQRRKDLLTPWPWVGALIAAVLCAPIFIWNIQYDWPGFRYQFHDRHTGETFDLNRWYKFLGMQIGLMSPGFYIAMILAFVAAIKNWSKAQWRLIACLFLPCFVIFYPQPMWADFKPHWMGGAYYVLNFGVGYLASQSRKIFWLVVSFLIPLNILIYTPNFYPFVPKVARYFNPQIQWNPKNDVSNEMFGWPELGEFALNMQKEIELQTGHRPFMASHRYETTAQTYMATKQKTYMLSFTRSHYSVTQQPEQVQQLLGQDAVFVTTEKYEADPLSFAKFDSCTPREFKFYRLDELSRIFTVYHCKNFQGILR